MDSLVVAADSARAALKTVCDSLAHHPDLPAPAWPVWASTAIGAGAAILGGLLAQLLRAWIEDQRMKRQVIMRIRFALETVVANAGAAAKKDKAVEVNPEVLEGIIVEWRRYDRVSDDIGLLSDANFAERVDNWLTFCRMLAEQVREDEARFRQTRRELGKNTGEGLQIPHKVSEEIEAKRAKHLNRLGMTSAGTKGLLDEFNKKWPPAAKDNPREVPGEGEGEK